MKDLRITELCRGVCPAWLRRPLGAAWRRARTAWFRAMALTHPRQAVWLCPCCGVRLRSFVSGGFISRPDRYDPKRYANTCQNVLCPACGSVARHRILASWCDAHIQTLRRAAVLYFAPEYGMMLWMKRNGIRCTTADLNHHADLRLDIQDTGLRSGSYDIVICNHVLEHVSDFRAAIREVHRILRPAGVFICSFPMDPKEELLDEDASIATAEGRLRRFGQVDHLRVFGMKAGRFLEEAGFKVRQINGADYPDEILPVVGPADYDMNILFYCVKTN